MKQEFSTKWIASKQPRRQRKYRHNAPLHTRSKFLNAHLSKGLREKYKTRSLRLRTGDEVEVMRGSFAGKKAKVTSVDVKRTRVVLEGITRGKKDGSKVNVFFDPSNLTIFTVYTDDRKRFVTKEETKEKK